MRRLTAAWIVMLLSLEAVGAQKIEPTENDFVQMGHINTVSNGGARAQTNSVIGRPTELSSASSTGTLAQLQAVLNNDRYSWSDRTWSHRLTIVSADELRLDNGYVLVGTSEWIQTSTYVLPLGRLVQDVASQSGSGFINLTLKCDGGVACITVNANGVGVVSEAVFSVEASNADRVVGLFKAAIRVAWEPVRRSIDASEPVLASLRSLWSLVEMVSFGTTATSYKAGDGVTLIRTPPVTDCGIVFTTVVPNPELRWEARLGAPGGSLPTVAASGKVLVIDSSNLLGGTGTALSARARLLFGFVLPDDAARARAELMRFFSICTAR